MSKATCHTDGCGNADQAIDVELTYTDPDGATHQLDGVVCGACGQPITDVVG